MTLSPEDNEALCHVGPGTLMGDLMREYWLPFMYPSELGPDDPPIRVRLLGEDLVAFRATSGQIGLISDHCAHRGAGMFFGRNEEDGLRCVYHGWKYDVGGRCVDMPNEPAESNFKDRVRIKAYRCAVGGGMVWAYMGPSQAEPPGLPQLEWTLLPASHVRHGFKHVLKNNFMQGLEGDIDSSHIGFLHNHDMTDTTSLARRDKAPRLEVVDSDSGMLYAAIRNAGNGRSYYRTSRLVMPFHTFFAGGPNGSIPSHIWVPIDDVHTLVLDVSWNPVEPLPSTAPSPLDVGNPGFGPMLPEQKGQFFARWWPVPDWDNDFLLDRELQRTTTFTGLPTVRIEDGAMTTSMGAILDRTIEHLGTTDVAIIRARQRLLGAARALRENGTRPPGVEHPEACRVRTLSAVLPTGSDWQNELADWHQARAHEILSSQADAVAGTAAASARRDQE